MSVSSAPAQMASAPPVPNPTSHTPLTRAVERTWSTAAWMSFFQPLIEKAPWLPAMPRRRGENATKPMSSAMRSASSAMADTAPAVPAGPDG